MANSLFLFSVKLRVNSENGPKMVEMSQNRHFLSTNILALVDIDLVGPF